MQIDPLPLTGSRLITFNPRQDNRGAFTRLFCREELAALGMNPIAQINRSRTRKVGAVRGMHFQHSPRAENKLITCIKGRVFDVIVDLRTGSSTFLHWHGTELAEGLNRMLFAPRGFAHGFQVLEPDSELLYLHDEFYAPECEGAIHATDPKIAVAWPMPVSELSDRDTAHPLLDENFRGVTL